ncbi:low molecular weight protein-tyrosine-phosphatase [Pacificimonas sp. ICDLI1SI03]
MQNASILFVCLGNICRSPVAEGLLRSRAAAAGIEVLVDSAGTGDWHLGQPPHEGAQAVATANGLDLSGLRARQVTEQDWFDFTHLIALDRSNFQDLEALRPANAKASLSMLMDHAGRDGEDVIDPYGMEEAAFSQMYAQIDEGVAGLLKALSR